MIASNLERRVRSSRWGVAVRGPSFILLYVLCSTGILHSIPALWACNDKHGAQTRAPFVPCPVLCFHGCVLRFLRSSPAPARFDEDPAVIYHTYKRWISTTCSLYHSTAGQPCAALGCAVMCSRWDIKHMHDRPDELRVMAGLLTLNDNSWGYFVTSEHSLATMKHVRLPSAA